MISIIIPTYKSEKTIRYCLDSVLAQSFYDFECLIIDYPENDNTKEIVLNYCRKDNRICYMESKNKGAMSQREYGIKMAQGNYICFVDSDDLIHKDYLKTLYESITKSHTDLATCKMARINDFKSAKLNDSITTKITIKNNRKYKKMLKNYRKNIGSPTPVCIIGKKNVFLEATKYYNHKLNIKYWEDAVLSYYIYFNSKSVALVESNPLYFYVNTPISTTKQIIDHRKYMNDCFLVSNTTNAIIKKSKYKHLSRQTYIYSIFGMIDMLINDACELKVTFKYVRNQSKKYVNIARPKVFEKEFTLSEMLLSMSLKYNLFILAKITIVRLKSKQKNN